jgi:glycine/D-amino acid oxidase-like deaminating enzyme
MISPRASSDAAPRARHDVVVVGNGPVGSAVARHVAEAGKSVLVLDGSDTLTSASNDVGRIVRPLDAEGRETWTEWNVRSIDAFPSIEARSGIEFFRKCGSLACGTPAFVEKPRRRLEEARVAHVSHASGGDVERAFPFLNVPKTHVAVSDAVGGFVDPGKMIQAQNAIMLSVSHTGASNRARKTSCAVVRDSAVGVDRREEEEEEERGAKKKAAPFAVRTKKGATYEADAVVLAGGAYTRWLASSSGLLPVENIPAKNEDGLSPEKTRRSGVGAIRNSRRTVLLAEVTEATARGALRDMPTVKYQFAPAREARGNEKETKKETEKENSHSRNEAMSVYVLPPILYPGPDPPKGWYVKIGGGANDFFDDSAAGTARVVEDLDAWMRSDGDEAVADALHDVLVSLMPDVNFLSLVSKPCVTTCTDDGELQCDALGGGGVFAVSGCQGKAAGPADAIGRDVAEAVIEAM